MTLDVLAPGLLTTVQDLGRPGVGHLGVPHAGAVDPWSLRVANALLGNDPGDAALELTLVGPELRVAEPLDIALAGADLGGIASGPSADVVLPPGRSAHLVPGTVVRFPGPVAGEPGIRAYLAVRGGLDVPSVLGSRSTAIGAGFGGLEGRPLRAGDTVRPIRGAAVGSRSAAWPAEFPHPLADAAGVVRVLAVPAPGAGGSRTALAALCERSWRIGTASDRMGLRLEGRTLAGGSGATLTMPTTWGSIQLPADGQPIVLLADHQPTGGYPIVGVAISADRPILGQLRPGAAISFREVSAEEALDALVGQRRRLDAAIAELEQQAGWDELSLDAGA